MREQQQPLLRPIEAAEWLRQRLNLPRAPHPSTIRRWIVGLGTGGVCVRATVLGGRAWYAAADLEAFVQELNGGTVQP